MIAPVVAGTSHTFVTRRPCADACGTRVQTMPLALATSIAATRATSCSYSSSWISCGSCIAGPSPPSPWARYQGCPGASVGNRKSEPRAPSTVRDPSRSRPRRQTDSTASATRNAPASAGNPARFSRLHGVPRRDMETDRKMTSGEPGGSQPWPVIGEGGAVGLHRAVGDRAADLGGDGVGDHLGAGGGELHAPAGVVLAQAVGDVEVLLEVVGQGEVEERPAGRGQLHAGAEAALDHGQVADGQVLVEAVDVGVDLEPG